MAQKPAPRKAAKGRNVMATIADLLKQKAKAGPARRQPMMPPQAMPQGGAGPSPDSMMAGATPFGN